MIFFLLGIFQDMHAQSIKASVVIAGITFNITNNYTFNSPVAFTPSLINNTPLIIKNASTTTALTLTQTCVPAPCTYITVGGSGASDFTINQSSITGSIAANSSQSFYVSISPTATNGGLRTDTFTLHTNDPSNPIFKFYITYTISGVLPVDFISYKAVETADGTLISWTVTNEYNNKGYYIKRSVDGVIYSTVGFVPGNNQAGILTYQYTDSPAEGTVYYKIVQEDFDGNIISTPVFYISFFLNNLASLYPNPFTSSFSIKLPDNESPAIYQVFTASGILIDSGTITSILANLGNSYVSGIYFVHIITSTESTTSRLIKN